MWHIHSFAPPTVLDSRDELIAPPTLSRVLEQEVTYVECAPFDVPHLSGSRIERVLAHTSDETIALVLKRFEPQEDWVMRLTHDAAVREVALYRAGVYAQLPTTVQVPILAVARDGDSWCSLMADVSDAVAAGSRSPVDAGDAEAWLTHLAQIHAQFWQGSALAAPSLGLAALEDFLTILSPARVQAELDAGRTHPVLVMAAQGWERWRRDAPSDVRRIVTDVQSDPAPLLARLRAMPQTLVHGDFKAANLGIRRTGDGERQSVVLDWQDAARGAGALDLGYFLALDARRLMFDKEHAVSVYRDALRTQGRALEPSALDWALFAGGPMRLFWLMANNAQPDRPEHAAAQAELDWWYALVRRLT